MCFCVFANCIFTYAYCIGCVYTWPEFHWYTLTAVTIKFMIFAWYWNRLLKFGIIRIYDNFTDWKPKCLLHFFVLFTKLETKHLYEPVGRSLDLSVGRSVRFPKRWEVSLPCSYQSTCFNVPKLRFLFLMLQVEVSPTTSHFLSPIISLFPNMYYEACSKKKGCTTFLSLQNHCTVRLNSAS